MSRQCFEYLCFKIENIVGEDEFKSEEYLRGLTLGKSMATKMSHAHDKSTGGFISGKIKVAHEP